MDGTVLGQQRNPSTLYDPRIVQMPLDALYQRFTHISLASYYPLIHFKSNIISKSDPPPYDARGLPLVIREKDPEYQFHRIILFRRFLHVSEIYVFNVNKTILDKDSLKLFSIYF